MGIIIKMNDLYYDVSDGSYDTEHLIYNKIGDLSSNVKELLSSSTLTPNDLSKIKVYYSNIVEVTPKMSSNTTPIPFVASASSQYNTTYVPWKAFNGTNSSNTDCWITANNVVSGWLMIDLNSNTPVNSFKITSRYGTEFTSSPKDFTLEGSNDGVKFNILKTISNEKSWGSNITKEYDLETDVSYRYYRLNITANNGQTYSSLANFKLFYKTITERFKPIDKFNDFQIISKTDDIVMVNGTKSNKELIVASEDIKIKSDIINEINYLSLDSLGNVKVVFSIDSGLSWQSYDNGVFMTLSSTIPLKDYSRLTATELLQWNNALNDIIIKGMTSDTLKTINFNQLTFSKIRFAYVITRGSYTDLSRINRLSLNFDAMGHVRKMKKTEYDALLYDHGLYIKSLIDSPIIKINALLKETVKPNIPDSRTQLTTPSIGIQQIGNEITISWNSVQFADYYKVYVNGVCIDKSVDTSSTFTIEKMIGNYLFCLRAYSNDINKYKPSDFSNMEKLDFSGYLANVDTVDSGYNYVGIKLGGNLFRFKVKNNANKTRY